MHSRQDDSSCADNADYLRHSQRVPNPDLPLERFVAGIQVAESRNVWSWRSAGSGRNTYAQLYRGTRHAGELAFIVDVPNPATIYTDVVAVLNRHEMERRQAHADSAAYDARRTTERDDQP